MPLVPAWVTFACHAEREIHHHFAHFELVGIPAPLSRVVFTSPIALDLDRNAWPHRELLELRETRSIATAMNVQAACYRAVALALDKLDTWRLDLLVNHGQAQKAIAPALAYIDRHLQADMRVGILADLCGYCTDHFIRIFKESTGQTPVAYITDRRMTRASQLLVYTDLTIEEVSEEVGYCNRYYFSRVFTRVMGTPPGHYRSVHAV